MIRLLAAAVAGSAAAAAGAGLLVLTQLRRIDDAFDVPLDAPAGPAARIPTPRRAA